jgi:hypothetical protein
MLPPGNNFTFVITDRCADGISGLGILYELNLNIDRETGEPIASVPSDGNTYDTDGRDSILLLDGNGDFGAERLQGFHLPLLDDIPTPGPVAPTVSPAPTVYMVPVHLTIHFDPWQEETGWSIVDVEYPDKVFASAPPTTYRAGPNVTETIMLPPGRDYALIMTDTFGDGMQEPEGYFLWMMQNAEDGRTPGNIRQANTAVAGSPNKKQVMVILVEGGGDFGLRIVHNFTLPP